MEKERQLSVDTLSELRKSPKKMRSPFDSPKKGPTLSTSTSSFEAVDPHDPVLNNLASTMFSKTADWVSGELESTIDEYYLLEQMNRVTLTKYSDMRQITTNIDKGVSELNKKYENLLPYLDQIDQIDESISRLEQAAYKLDAYSKRLEAKFKILEKRSV
ncbi:biogenesis of lysosome-related organelles complex 1 subunit 2 [Eurytemora carolleeae]|uniref:biogenesis of lysosome-related organelles complex 1 subunit 2 n=1 Tax=Eurytemora carolleeae TaxID=1294199 RepID=UPI000C75DDB7|nr:biogenesis of lysosome-related organelles complex 1 subunit 2 [Eurytemora carolleeae]|eukprot:XP_023338685.1 biogenesis of lysosome-related organelles complex 1 subunit 2-like [Eurytemora affinis]